MVKLSALATIAFAVSTSAIADDVKSQDMPMSEILRFYVPALPDACHQDAKCVSDELEAIASLNGKQKWDSLPAIERIGCLKYAVGESDSYWRRVSNCVASPTNFWAYQQ